MLIRMVQEKMNRMVQSRESALLPEPKTGTPSPATSAPAVDANAPKESSDGKMQSVAPTAGAPGKP